MQLAAGPAAQGRAAVACRPAAPLGAEDRRTSPSAGGPDRTGPRRRRRLPSHHRRRRRRQAGARTTGPPPPLGARAGPGRAGSGRRMSLDIGPGRLPARDSTRCWWSRQSGPGRAGPGRAGPGRTGESVRPPAGGAGRGSPNLPPSVRVGPRSARPAARLTPAPAARAPARRCSESESPPALPAVLLRRRPATGTGCGAFATAAAGQTPTQRPSRSGPAARLPARQASAQPRRIPSPAAAGPCQPPGRAVAGRESAQKGLPPRRDS